MKRWALRVFVFLLLGAIVNIAVAWGCCLTVHQRLVRGSRNPPVVFQQPMLEGCRLQAVRRTEYIGSGVLQYRYDSDTSYAAGPTGNVLVHLECGLPKFSFVGWRLDDSTNVAALSTPNGLQKAESAQSFAASKILPFGMIWPGFAINTLFYAGILWGGWLLFAAPFALRRRRRIKRGLCPACAYDLRGSVGGSQTCPECGKAPLVKHIAETQKA